MAFGPRIFGIICIAGALTGAASLVIAESLGDPAACPGWREGAIRNRRDALFILSPASMRPVLIGGYAEGENGAQTVGDLWEWAGSHWIRSSSTSVPNWYAPLIAGAIDIKHRRVLALSQFFQTETWSWDGAAWSRLDVSTPQFDVWGLGFVYDTSREQFVVRGYVSSQHRWETWSYDGGWTILNSAGPMGRTTGMAYDDARQQIVLFAADQPAGTTASTWTLHGDTWLLASDQGPTARSGATMTYDPARAETILFGGTRAASNQLLSDTWAWNGQAWRQLTPAISPSARTSHAAAYDPNTQQILIAGGSWQESTLDLWTWNGTEWSLLAPSPAARLEPSVAFDSDRNRLVVWGGQSDQSTMLPPDVWEFDGTSWTRIAAPGPRPYARVPMVYDIARRRTFLLGPTSSNNLGMDVWEWNGQVWSLHLGEAANADPPGNPGVRYQAGAAFDKAHGKTVLFGGMTPSGSPRRTETWEWDGEAWERKSSTGPSPRFGHAMAFDEARNRVVLHGGTPLSGYDGNPLRDTWEWDGTSWSLVGTDGPAGFHSTLAFDPERRRTFLFGKFADGSGSYSGIVWEWDGSHWSPLRFAFGPTTREWAGAAAATGLGGVALFGGYSTLGKVCADLFIWEPQGAPTCAEQHPIEETHTVDEFQVFQFKFPACRGTELTWVLFKDGSPVEGYQGDYRDNIRNVSLGVVTTLNAGVYEIVVSNGCGSLTVVRSALHVRPGCASDLNHDGLVSSADLTALLQHFGQSTQPRLNGDDNADGTINTLDLLSLLGKYGRACP